MRYFLCLSYDGTNFHGWQRQPNVVSIQQTIEDALSVILREKKEIVGAGRTDTGVHASEMFAHFDAGLIQDKKRFITSMNRMLGNEITINNLFQVSEDAHARFDALSRTYHYHISMRKNPFTFRYAHFISAPLDIDKMNKASEILLHTEDFTSFAKLHSDAKTNICNVSRAEWLFDINKNSLVFIITANRFLRNMVRAVVGTLLEVGMGKVSLDGFRNIILEKDRCAAGPSVPAKGLFLTDIVYPKDIIL